MALLPLLQWHCHRPQVGVIAIIAVALLSSLMCRCPCHHCDGVVALIAMALLPLMGMHLHHFCNCNCCPHDNGIDAVVNVQASLPLSSWHCCSCNNGIVALDLQRPCCPHCNGAVVILKLALLPSLQWHCQYH